MEIKPLNNLKKIREGRNLSYLDMAKKLSISKTFYWQIENGYRRLNYDMAKKISIIFKLMPDKIFYNDF